MFALRGAIQVERNSSDAITAAVQQLCAAVSRANRLTPARIISAIFTLTPDLTAAFPARVAREQGWSSVPMLCTQELNVPGSLPRVCRLLLHVRGRQTPKHVYLSGAEALRPDLVTPARRRPKGRKA